MKRIHRGRCVWQVPPMERTLSSIARTLDELFTRQTDLRRELLRLEAYSNHLLRDLRGRHDALHLITSLYWNQTFVLSESTLAEQLGISVAELQAHVSPLFLRTDCMRCGEEIEVRICNRDEADKTLSGELLWSCPFCLGNCPQMQASCTGTETRSRSRLDNLIELPTRTQKVQ